MSFGLSNLLSGGWVGAQGFAVQDAGAGLTVKRADIDPADISDATEVDTGVDLPDPCIVLDVFLDVETAESTATTKTLDVGLLSSEASGDADGFLNDADVSAAGIVRGGLTETAGMNENHISAVTYGALLADFELGTDTSGDHGYLARKYHIVDGDAVSLSVTGGDSNGFTEFEGSVYAIVIALGS